MAKKVEKGRNFAWLIYPESAPKDWKERLEKLDIPMAISPLHDKDVREIDLSTIDELTAEEQATLKAGKKLYKKAHWHGLGHLDGPITAEGFRLKLKRALGDGVVSHVEIVDGVKSYYDYLTHESKDAIKKKKHKYDKADLTFINNFDIDRYITLDVEDKEDLFNEICDIIDDHDLANMRELKNFVKYHGAEDGLPSMKVIRSVMKMSSGIIRLTFDAVYQERRYGRADIDKDTGEVLNNK